MGPKCYAVQCIVNGEENLKITPFPLGFPYRDGRGNRACACGSRDILADRQTDTHTLIAILLNSRERSNKCIQLKRYPH